MLSEHLAAITDPAAASQPRALNAASGGARPRAKELEELAERAQRRPNLNEKSAVAEKLAELADGLRVLSENSARHEGSIAAANAENVALKVQLRTLEERTAEFQGLIAAATDENFTLKVQLRTLEAKTAEVQYLLAAATAENGALKVKTTELQGQTSALRAENSAWKADLGSIKMENGRMKQQLDDLTKVVAALQRREPRPVAPSPPVQDRTEPMGPAALENRNKRKEKKKLDETGAAVRIQRAFRNSAHDRAMRPEKFQSLVKMMKSNAKRKLQPLPLGAVAAPSVFEWSRESCGKNVTLSYGNRRASVTGSIRHWSGTALGAFPNPASFKVRVLPNDAGIVVGLASMHAFKPDSKILELGGYFIGASSGTLYHGSINDKSYFRGGIKNGAIIEVRYNRAARQIGFAIDGLCPGVAFADVDTGGADLYPAVNFGGSKECTVELLA